MNREQKACTPPACQYDRNVETKAWRGPEVLFGLTYLYVQPGQSLLDIGIGTGLGSLPFHKAGLHIYGMDLSADMLEACRAKGFAEDLKQHDLLLAPYPFPDASMDHVISVGVLNHFSDLTVVFGEARRILHDEGTFGFMVLGRPAGESSQLVLDLSHTQAGKSVTLYRHGEEEVGSLLGDDFVLLKSVEFTVYLEGGQKNPAPAKTYVAKRKKRN
jgi:ubiquinone/menaquinone biosynthesis C-methylase UbiE